MRYIRFLFSVFISALMPISAALAEENAIKWNEWGPAPFAQARSENKIILIDVGMEGCTACRWMDEGTYRDPAVIHLINAHFIPVAVDAEARPDIGERYSDWAWPATIFMAPDTTQVLALRGNRIPKHFIPILNGLLEKQKKGALTADELAPYAAPPAPTETALTLIRNRVRAQLDNSFNEQTASWSDHRVSTSSGARIQHLFFRAHLYNMAELRKLGIAAAHNYLDTIDPVWGGVFVAAFYPAPAPGQQKSKAVVIPEKRIANQANALNVFAEAYRHSGSTVYLRGIKDVDRYLQRWMMAGDGTFYTSQEDVPAGLPATMDAEAYWSLQSDSARRRYGVPPVDHAVYTDKNGQIISAYENVYEATGKRLYLQTAMRAAQALVGSRRHTQGWLAQTRPTHLTATDRRMRPFYTGEKPFLSAQAWFGTALLAVYRGSGDKKWLDLATDLADAMLASLYDQQSGGFYATVAGDTAAMISPRKPLELNAVAAHFFYDLWVYTKAPRFQAVPERTLRAVALPDIIDREGKIVGQLALALEQMTAAYVEFSVVGSNDNIRARALFKAGMQTYHPRKLLHYEPPGRYPQRANPAMYICNPDMCSVPIEDPAQVLEKARAFRAAATNSQVPVPQ